MMKIDIKNIKDQLRWKVLHKALWVFFTKKIKWLLFIVLFAALGYGGYVWYFYVYNPQWTAQKKTEYMNAKDKGTVFNNAKFDEVVARWQERQASYQKDMSDLRDIFRLQDKKQQ